MTLRSARFAIAALGFAVSTHAHMVITNPVPFDQAALNNSPLAADGSDFPCKFGGASGYTDTVTTMNNYKAGESTELTFMGSASHGGGSCQVSYTTDAKPTKDSQWKVILSIVGGCPAAINSNLPVGSDPNYTGKLLNNYTIDFPKELPNGQGTLAWSWLNKIGNREFYMNCAPVTISGGANDASGLADLPDMFVANLPSTTCGTPSDVDFVYPDPGKNVKSGAATALASTFSVSNGCSTVTNLGKGAGKLGSPAKATDAPASTGGSDATASTPVAAPSNDGGIFAPGASSGSSAASTPTPSAPADTPVATPPASPSPAPAAASPVVAVPAPAGSGSGACTNGQVACSTPGFYCVSATQFGMCANGCALPQDVAAGTTCSGNTIAAARLKAKRAIRQHAYKHRRDAFGYHN